VFQNVIGEYQVSLPVILGNGGFVNQHAIIVLFRKFVRDEWVDSLEMAEPKLGKTMKVDSTPATNVQNAFVRSSGDACEGGKCPIRA